MIRVALLLLDDYVNEDKLDFADLGENLIRNSLKEAELEIKFEKFNYIKNLELPEDPNLFDLIYLTGSRNDSYLNNEFNLKLIEFLNNILDNSNNNKYKCKILGICFGHQIICRSLGFTVKPNDLGWELGNTEIKIDNCNELNLNSNLNFSSLVISEMHRDIAVVEDKKLLGKLQNEGIKIFGDTEICKIQGLYKFDKLLTFQGHPEFNSSLTLNMAKDKFNKNLISEEVLKDCIYRFENLKEDGNDINGSLKLQHWIKLFLGL